jgi:hypothetical protein
MLPLSPPPLTLARGRLYSLKKTPNHSNRNAAEGKWRGVMRGEAEDYDISLTDVPFKVTSHRLGYNKGRIVRFN